MTVFYWINAEAETKIYKQQKQKKNWMNLGGVHTTIFSDKGDAWLCGSTLPHDDAPQSRSTHAGDFLVQNLLYGVQVQDPRIDR